MEDYHGYGMKLAHDKSLTYKQDELNLSQEGIMAAFNLYNLSNLIATSGDSITL